MFRLESDTVLGNLVILLWSYHEDDKNDGTAIGWRKTKGTFRHGFSKWSIKNELNSECCAV